MTDDNAACWGALLKNLGSAKSGIAEPCTPGFVSGRAHLKNRLCLACAHGFSVPWEHVRALPSSLAHVFVNSKRPGLWTHVPGQPDMFYRVINQTSKCRGPPLIIFNSDPSVLQLEWAPIPEEWTRMEGRMKMVVAKGTIVPLQSITLAAKESQMQTGGGRSKRHREEWLSLNSGEGGLHTSAHPFAAPRPLHWLPPQVVPLGGPTAPTPPTPAGYAATSPADSSPLTGSPHEGRCTPVTLSDSSLQAEEEEPSSAAVAGGSMPVPGVPVPVASVPVPMPVATGAMAQAEVGIDFDWVEGLIAAVAEETGTEAEAVPLLAATLPSPPCSPADVDAQEPAKSAAVPTLRMPTAATKRIGWALQPWKGPSNRMDVTDATALMAIGLAWVCFHARNAATFFQTAQEGTPGLEPALWVEPSVPSWGAGNRGEGASSEGTFVLPPLAESGVDAAWMEACELDFKIHLVELFIGLALCWLLLSDQAVSTAYACISLGSQSTLLAVTMLCSQPALEKVVASSLTSTLMITWQWRVFGANGIVHALLPLSSRGQIGLLVAHIGLRICTSFVTAARLGDLEALRMCLLHNFAPILITFASTHAAAHALRKCVRAKRAAGDRDARLELGL